MLRDDGKGPAVLLPHRVEVALVRLEIFGVDVRELDPASLEPVQEEAHVREVVRPRAVRVAKPEVVLVELQDPPGLH